MSLHLPQILYFVRHGETDWNRDGRLQGQKDIPINGRGEDQAKAVGRTLAAHLTAEGFDQNAIAALSYKASPLQRTMQTMRLMRASMGLDPQKFTTDERLKELSFGAWEGLTWRDVKDQIPASALERERGKWDFVPPRGESYALLARRVRPWLDELMQAHISNDVMHKAHIVVSHGGVARVLLTMLSDVSPHMAATADIWQGRVLKFWQGRAEWV
jgi:probable phosphoglycerate mutase